MINIDGVFYEGSLNKTRIKINEKWKDVLVLDIDVDLEPIDIIKYQDKVYKIDKIINRFEDNKKWLTYIQESPDLEKKKIEELLENNKQLKKDNELLSEGLVEIALSVEQNNIENELAIAELANILGGLI